MNICLIHKNAYNILTTLLRVLPPELEKSLIIWLLSRSSIRHSSAKIDSKKFDNILLKCCHRFEVDCQKPSNISLTVSTNARTKHEWARDTHNYIKAEIYASWLDRNLVE